MAFILLCFIAHQFSLAKSSAFTSLVAQLVRNLPAMRRPGFDPWVGKIPRQGKGYPLQYSGVGNSMDCIVHRVTESDTTEWLLLSAFTKGTSTANPCPILRHFFFFFISWRLITLQYCSRFCHKLTWISHGYTCIPHPDLPSHLPLHPIPGILVGH